MDTDAPTAKWGNALDLFLKAPNHKTMITDVEEST